MQPSLQHKLSQLVIQHKKLGQSMSDPTVIQDLDRYRTLAKEYSHLTPIVEQFQAYQQAQARAKEAEQMLSDEDPDMQVLAKAEWEAAKADIAKIEAAIQVLLLPKDPNDERDVFLEIRAGAGGDEAAIFAGDLFRMYTRHAEKRGWQVEIVSEHEGERGGFKEIIALFSGKAVYSRMKFESGVHRVQRVPETEAQGRVHTSTCTVAVMPKIEAIDSVTIRPDELRIDTFRASGAGGQHVNRTDSAVRITHIPTGIVAECQQERSQHQNRAKAMVLLQARLLSAEQRKQQKEQTETRRSLVGTGDRSEKIRTYNFPQNRVTDHRVNLTLYKLDIVLDGELDELTDVLSQAHEAELLEK
jgi:peptide chain release factor 1